MTKEEKIAVQLLRDNGRSNNEISDELGISCGSLRTYLSRLGKARICLKCGEVVKQPPHTRPKRFCSDTCRYSWWRANADKVSHQISESLVCRECGRSFVLNRNRPRKYCSRVCYFTARRKSHDEQ